MFCSDPDPCIRNSDQGKEQIWVAGKAKAGAQWGSKSSQQTESVVAKDQYSGSKVRPELRGSEGRFSSKTESKG